MESKLALSASLFSDLQSPTWRPFDPDLRLSSSSLSPSLSPSLRIHSLQINSQRARPQLCQRRCPRLTLLRRRLPAPLWPRAARLQRHQVARAVPGHAQLHLDRRGGQRPQALCAAMVLQPARERLLEAEKDQERGDARPRGRRHLFDSGQVYFPNHREDRRLPLRRVHLPDLRLHR